jgi:hypothetical protein
MKEPIYTRGNGRFNGVLYAAQLLQIAQREFFLPLYPTSSHAVVSL